MACHEFSQSNDFYTLNFMFPDVVCEYVLQKFPKIYVKSIKELSGKFTEEEVKTIIECGQNLVLLTRGEHTDIAGELEAAGHKELADRIRDMPYMHRLALAIYCVIHREGGFSNDPDENERFIQVLVGDGKK